MITHASRGTRIRRSGIPAGTTFAKRIVLLALPAVFLFGCCHCKDSVADRPPFSIELSAGGGFSGMWTGYILHSNGTVQSWDGWQTKVNGIKTVGELDPGEIFDLMTLIDKNELMKRPYRDTGNMTTMLRVTRGDEMQFITWPGTVDDDSGVPADAREAYQILRALIKKMRPQKDG